MTPLPCISQRIQLPTSHDNHKAGTLMPNSYSEQWIEMLTRVGIDPSKLPDQSIWSMHTEHIPEFFTPAQKRRPGKSGKPVMQAEQPYVVGPGELPGWGKMDDDTLADLLPWIPFDWKVKPDTDPTTEEYAKWIVEVIETIHSNL